jgi:hypothetical protein
MEGVIDEFNMRSFKRKTSFILSYNSFEITLGYTSPSNGCGVRGAGGVSVV